MQLNETEGKGRRSSAGGHRTALSAGSYPTRFQVRETRDAQHTYLAVALDGTSGLTAASRELGGRCFTQGEGLVAVVAGRVLEGPFRFGIELERALGEEAGPCGDRI